MSTPLQGKVAIMMSALKIAIAPAVLTRPRPPSHLEAQARMGFRHPRSSYLV
jgi:hypothetical protein